MRIVASMTTIPSRLPLIRPVLEAVLAQSVPISHIELNIPVHCIRTGEPYRLPEWLFGLDGVRLVRPLDFGPITKVAPTLMRYRRDPQTYVWSVDDDCRYPDNQLDLLWRHHQDGERCILTRHGGHYEADDDIHHRTGHGTVDMLEGFGGVLYPPCIVEDDFLDFVNAAIENPDCRANDDVVLSYYFRERDVPIVLHNSRANGDPYKPPAPCWMPYADAPDALKERVRGDPGHYKRALAYLGTLKVPRQT
jgi:hypothetical protein